MNWSSPCESVRTVDLSVARDHMLEPESGAKMSSLMQDTLHRFRRLPLVSVAAIEGYALGGGAELTTACDHRCMSVLAKVKFVQVKMATVPGWGGSARLAEIVGRTRALRILGASEVVDGQRALDIGYASVLAEAGDTVATATQFLDPYVFYTSPSKKETETFERKRNSVNAVRSLKRIIGAMVDQELETVTHLEHDMFCKLWGQEENRQAILGAGSKSQ